MEPHKHSLFWKASLRVSLLALAGHVGAQQSPSDLKIEDLMTPSEVTETGVSGLTPAQRAALNRWLSRYTATVLAVARQNVVEKVVPAPASPRTSCVPAVESTIAGDFNGWEGETIFKLDNGQIWQQAEYDYTYSYAYRPSVTIYQTSQGCRMKVEDEDETIVVRRIR